MNGKHGKDKRYFSDFYAYLCNYAHCNYSILDCYLDENNMYTLSGKKDEYLVRILVLFVYTKTFESIVTVEGEYFLDKREEKLCYELVTDANMFLYQQLEYLSQHEFSEKNKELNKHMKNMFKDMKKSLTEEIGSVKKNF